MSLPKIALIACGSYSPPTNMHLRMFEIARDYFLQMGSHQVVGGIVSPVHDSYGKSSLLPSKHRASMVKLALQTSDWIKLSDWEIQQEQWTRTRLTLQYHQNYMNSYLNDINGSVNDIIPGWLPENIKNSSGNIQVKLLCGADLLESFATPGLWDPNDIEAIVGQHGIVVVTRNGANPEQFIFNSDILTKYRRNIHIVTNWVSNEISSTVVRKLIGRGQSVKYLIDDYVIEYIKKNGLFGAKDSKFILTPNQNEVLFVAPPSSKQFNNTFIEKYRNNENLHNENEETMDETDYSSTSNFFPQTEKLIRPKVFCCADGISVKGLLNLNNNENRSKPGQAVQIITDVNGEHTTAPIDHELKVGSYIISEADDTKPSVGVDETEPVYKTSFTELYNDENGIISDDDGGGRYSLENRKSSGGRLSLPSTSSRHNDIIKFVFTDHGIRVISDKEYVV